MASFVRGVGLKSKSSSFYFKTLSLPSLPYSSCNYIFFLILLENGESHCEDSRDNQDKCLCIVSSSPGGRGEDHNGKWGWDDRKARPGTRGEGKPGKTVWGWGVGEQGRRTFKGKSMSSQDRSYSASLELKGEDLKAAAYMEHARAV